MRVCIFTSSRAVSLKKVANDIKKVITTHDKGITVSILDSPAINVDILKSCDACMITMPFDLTWCMPYFFIAYEFKSQGKPTIFYATTEGRVPKEMVRNWILRDLDFVVNSEYVKSRLEEVNAKIVDVIPHGVEIDKISLVRGWRDEVREALGVGDKTLVGYVASGHERKCHDLFSEVVKEVRNTDPTIEFLIITDKKGSKYYDGTDAIVKEEFGVMSDEQYYSYMHAMDIYAHGSCSEGFGIPVLEALACGKYVVHGSYDPLNKITTPEVSSRVPPYEILLVKIGGAGIVYELKRYRPATFAKHIINTATMLRNLSKSDLISIYDKALTRAYQYDINKVYTRFIPMLKHNTI